MTKAQIKAFNDLLDAAAKRAEFEIKQLKSEGQTPEYWEKLTEAWLSTPEDVGPVYILMYKDGSWDVGDGWHRIAISISNRQKDVYAIWGEEK